MNKKDFIDVYKEITKNKISMNNNSDFFEIYLFNEDTYEMNLLIYENALKLSKLIAFETKGYIENIIKSYHCSTKNIKKQFLLDFKRTNIFINSVYINKYTTFKKTLKQFYKTTCTHHVIKNIGILFLMLCNQSSYATPFQIIFNLYSNETDDIFVFSSENNRSINFIFDINTGSIIIETDLVLKDIKTNTTIRNINVKLNFALNINKITSYNIIDLDDILSKSFLILWN